MLTLHSMPCSFCVHDLLLNQCLGKVLITLSANCIVPQIRLLVGGSIRILVCIYLAFMTCGWSLFDEISVYMEG